MAYQSNSDVEAAVRPYAIRYKELHNDPTQKREADYAFAQMVALMADWVAIQVRRFRFRNDYDDLQQNAWLHIINAIDNFDTSRAFLPFASTVIHHRIASQIVHEKTQRRYGKHVSLNQITLNGDGSLNNVIGRDDPSLENIDIVDLCNSQLDRLADEAFTPVERHAFRLTHQDRYTYVEAAAIISRDYGIVTDKTGIDNAIIRYKAKSRLVLEREKKTTVTSEGSVFRKRKKWAICVWTNGVKYNAGGFATRNDALDGLKKLRKQIESGSAKPSGKKRRKPTSGEKCIYWKKGAGKWQVFIQTVNPPISLGYYAELAEAKEVLKRYCDTGERPIKRGERFKQQRADRNKSEGIAAENTEKETTEKENNMSILSNDNTPQSDAAKTAASVKSNIRRSFAQMKQAFTMSIRQVWHNSKATPQEIMNEFGTEARELFTMSDAIASLLASLDSEQVGEIVPAKYSVVFNTDGTVTVTENASSSSAA